MNIITLDPDGNIIELNAEAIHNHLDNAGNMRKRLESGGYTPAELLKMGRQNVLDENYLEAKVVFDELWSVSATPKVKRIAELYGLLIYNLATSNLPASLTNGYRAGIEGIMYCMKKAENMYKEKRMLKKDLLTIEKLVDRIPFERIKIPNKKEFEEVYCKFKEYVNFDVFIKEKRQKNI